jgi:hypothetical protein
MLAIIPHGVRSGSHPSFEAKAPRQWLTATKNAPAKIDRLCACAIVFETKLFAPLVKKTQVARHGGVVLHEAICDYMPIQSMHRMPLWELAFNAIGTPEYPTEV